MFIYVLFFIAVIIICVLGYKYFKEIKKYTRKNKCLSNNLKDERMKNTKMHKQIRALSAQLKKNQFEFEKKKERYNINLSGIKKGVRSLRLENSALRDFCERIKKLHPECDFEKEVEEMRKAEFEKAVSDLNQQIHNVLELQADKDRVATFEMVIKLYESASPEIKKAVTEDIGKVEILKTQSVNLRRRHTASLKAKELDEMIANITNMPESSLTIKDVRDVIKAYDSSNALTKNLVKADIMKVKKIFYILCCKDKARRAEDAANKLLLRICGKADENDRHTISVAFRYYEDLSSAERKYFSPEILAKMQQLRQEAEEDYIYQEKIRKEKGSDN